MASHASPQQRLVKDTYSNGAAKKIINYFERIAQYQRVPDVIYVNLNAISVHGKPVINSL